jgi:hypothetical protein
MPATTGFTHSAESAAKLYRWSVSKPQLEDLALQRRAALAAKFDPARVFEAAG